jgi:CheY-like chemotaxis protein
VPFSAATILILDILRRFGIFIPGLRRSPSPVENDDMSEEAQLHVRIPKDCYKKLKVICVNEDSSLQDYVANLIVESIGGCTDRAKSVLIVDDEPIACESLRDWLKDDYRVVTAETGEEAIRLIEKQDFDILIVDVRLPGKTGIEVLKEAKTKKPSVRAIVITAYPSLEMAIEAMKLGAVDYLVKPVAPDSLEKLIQETPPGSRLAEPKRQLKPPP